MIAILTVVTSSWRKGRISKGESILAPIGGLYSQNVWKNKNWRLNIVCLRVEGLEVGGFEGSQKNMIAILTVVTSRGRSGRISKEESALAVCIDKMIEKIKIEDWILFVYELKDQKSVGLKVLRKTWLPHWQLLRPVGAKEGSQKENQFWRFVFTKCLKR